MKMQMQKHQFLWNCVNNACHKSTCAHPKPSHNLTRVVLHFTFMYFLAE